MIVLSQVKMYVCVCRQVLIMLWGHESLYIGTQTRLCVCVWVYVTYCGSLRVSDVVDLLLTRHFQDMVNNSWKILQSHLIITTDTHTEDMSGDVTQVMSHR